MLPNQYYHENHFADDTPEKLPWETSGCLLGMILFPFMVLWDLIRRTK